MNVYCVNGWYLLKSITYPLNECVLCKWMVYELKCCCCCCYSITQLCSVCWDPMDCSMSGFPVLHHLPELAKTHIHRSVITSNDLILCRPRLLLPSIFPSIRVFSNESVLRIRRPKYWSFSFSISPECWHSINPRTLQVQGPSASSGNFPFLRWGTVWGRFTEEVTCTSSLWINLQSDEYPIWTSPPKTQSGTTSQNKALSRTE